MNKKTNRQSIINITAGVLGAAGAIASVVALLPAFMSLRQPNQPTSSVSGTGNAQINGSGNTQISNSVFLYKGAVDRQVREFKRFVSSTYLDNLPDVKCQAYGEARPLWNSGVTSDMRRGNSLVSERLRSILVNTAETAYTSDFFDGKPVDQYYTEIISNLVEVSRNAYPVEGTMWSVANGMDEIEITDDLIVKLVQDVAEPIHFQEWKKNWDRASEENCLTNF